MIPFFSAKILSREAQNPRSGDEKKAWRDTRLR
jgi:hypothetical protein